MTNHTYSISTKCWNAAKRGHGMSIIFGIQKYEGDPVSEPELQYLALATDRYAPDGLCLRTSAEVGMGFQPYHTHERSHIGVQPLGDGIGNLLSFKGRLDNYEDLSRRLGISDA